MSLCLSVCLSVSILLNSRISITLNIALILELNLKSLKLLKYCYSDSLDSIVRVSSTHFKTE